MTGNAQADALLLTIKACVFWGLAIAFLIFVAEVSLIRYSRRKRKQPRKTSLFSNDQAAQAAKRELWKQTASQQPKKQEHDSGQPNQKSTEHPDARYMPKK